MSEGDAFAVRLYIRGERGRSCFRAFKSSAISSLRLLTPTLRSIYAIWAFWEMVTGARRARTKVFKLISPKSQRRLALCFWVIEFLQSLFRANTTRGLRVKSAIEKVSGYLDECAIQRELPKQNDIRPRMVSQESCPFEGGRTSSIRIGHYTNLLS